jgi:hypothetical protein
MVSEKEKEKIPYWVSHNYTIFLDPCDLTVICPVDFLSYFGKRQSYD